MSRLTICYGRIQLETGQIPGQTSFAPPDELALRRALADAKSVSRYNHEWVLGNLDFDDEAGSASGLLGYPAEEQITRQELDTATHDFVQRVFELPDASTAAFVIDYRTGALAFDGDAGTSPGGFVRTLVALLDSAERGTFSGELIQVATSYREFLKVVDKVTRVVFEVRPTNPRDRAIFRPLDRGLKASNAESERVTLENRNEGLQVEPPASRDEETDNPAIMGIEMNDEGYGDGYRIDGERDGQTLRFDSHGGGLLKDVVDNAPDAPIDRIEPLRAHFGKRLELIEDPGALRRAPDDADEIDAKSSHALGIEIEEEDGRDAGDRGVSEP